MADLELLVKILNASDDIILAYQPDGNIIFMNLKGQNVFGYTEADQKPEISDFLSGGKESAYYADFLNGKEIKDAFLYRKNQTCFPADVHFVTGIDFFPILAFIKDCAREDEHSEIGGGIFLKLLMAIRNEDYEKSCLQYTVLFDAVSKNL